MIAAIIIAVAVTVALGSVIYRQRGAYAALLKEKHAADERASAAALREKEAIERRDFMAEKFDPLFDSVVKIRTQHSNAMNEMGDELAAQKQRALTLAHVIDKLLPDANLTEAQRERVRQQIEPTLMLNHIATMQGDFNGEAERSAHIDEA